MARQRRSALAAVLLLGAALLVGCTRPTPYQAMGADGSGPRYGYADRQLAEDRYRVTVSGNEATSRETVEDYLLYRAAELAHQRGAAGFRVVEREVQPVSRTIRTYSGPRRPVGRYFLPAPFRNSFYNTDELDELGPPFAASRELIRYRLSAEIELLRELPAAPGADVYATREVLTRLGPTIRRPPPAGG